MKSYTQKNNVKVIINIVALLLIAGSGFLLARQFLFPATDDEPTLAQSIPEAPQVEEVQQRAMEVDLTGVELTKTLKRYGFNMGFVGSDFPRDLGFEIPVEQSSQTRETTDASELESLGIPTPLEEVIPAPQNPQFRNRFVWEQYSIDAPINYASFADIFLTTEDGDFLLDQYVDNNPVDSPVQTKLKEGLVHLPFTPAPGEVGNSYIIGHSSNYSTVNSDFNFVFAPIINKVSEGETFTIFDNYGRELNFNVIDTQVVREEDVSKAYVKYGEKRTVSLQGSILEQTSQGLMPTKRYLVTGELVSAPLGDSQQMEQGTISPLELQQ